MNEAKLLDRSAIRDLIENWAVWRDAGDWDRFKTVWHEDGWMFATWFQGTAPDFIRVSKEGRKRISTSSPSRVAHPSISLPIVPSMMRDTA